VVHIVQDYTLVKCWQSFKSNIVIYHYMSGTTDLADRITFIESLNDLLSAENTIVERLYKRISEIPIQELKKVLQQQLKEQHRQQSRLENLIAYYGGKPTNSKAELVPLNYSTAPTPDDIIEKNNVSNNIPIESDHTIEMTPKGIAISNAKEDTVIKNAEILEYKRILKISEKIKAKDATNILKQNLKEKESMFNKIKSIPSKMYNQTNDNNNESPFRLGSAIGDVLTSYWNSKENPSKVYIFNRRVHHGGIGALLGLSSLYKNQPIITGILSGLGARLAKDDYKDSKEWFSFKKKEDDVEK
jgi:ferritin-like metal-binding protein YciE